MIEVQGMVRVNLFCFVMYQNKVLMWVMQVMREYKCSADWEFWGDEEEVP